MKIPLLLLSITLDADDLNIPRVDAGPTTEDRILTTVFVIAGAVAVLFIIINAFRYVISQGDAGKISQAKDGILYGLAGLVIISLSYAIVQVVINVIRGPI